MKTTYRIIVSSMFKHNWGWCSNGEVWTEDFEDCDIASGRFDELVDGELRETYLTERAFAPGHRMTRRGFCADLLRVVTDEDGYEHYTDLDYCQYTCDDHAEEE